MPSEKVLTEKQALVAELKNKLTSSSAGVVVNYGGISVADDTKLRAALRAEGVDYAVVKNTMLRLAVKDTDLEGLTDTFTGSTAVAVVTGDDPMAAARILNKYAEDSKGKFELKGGYMDGNVMDAAGVKAIANLPGREGLLSMLLSALQGNLRGLAVALNAVAEQKEEVA